MIQFRVETLLSLPVQAAAQKVPGASQMTLRFRSLSLLLIFDTDDRQITCRHAADFLLIDWRVIYQEKIIMSSNEVKSTLCVRAAEKSIILKKWE